MQGLMRVFLWRPQQPALARWAEAAALAGVALMARFYVGTLLGANPGVEFFPALLAATILLGWPEALFVLVLSVSVGWYWFVPPGMVLMPVVWLVAGSLMIGIIAAFRATAQELAAANERQKILFQVARQRVANAARNDPAEPEAARTPLSPARAEAVRILEDAARRIAGAADAHNRSRNPELVRRELDSILRDAVAAVIDRRDVTLTVDVDPLDLTFDLMSTVTMLVMEIASNAQKNVFRQGHGSQFSVALKAAAENRATLTVKDDRTASATTQGTAATEWSRGLEIVQTLVSRMHGSMQTSFAQGAEFAIEFPLHR